MDSLEPRDLLAFSAAGEATKFALSSNVGPSVQKASSARTLDLVANFVRKNTTAKILLAMPWTDSARTELICDQIKMLLVSAKLLLDVQIRTLTNYALRDINALSSFNCNARRE